MRRELVMKMNQSIEVGATEFGQRLRGMLDSGELRNMVVEICSQAERNALMKSQYVKQILNNCDTHLPVQFERFFDAMIREQVESVIQSMDAQIKQSGIDATSTTMPALVRQYEREKDSILTSIKAEQIEELKKALGAATLTGAFLWLGIAPQVGLPPMVAAVTIPVVVGLHMTNWEYETVMNEFVDQLLVAFCRPEVVENSESRFRKGLFRIRASMLRTTELLGSEGLQELGHTSVDELITATMSLRASGAEYRPYESVVWIDANVNNGENAQYQRILRQRFNNLACFTTVEEVVTFIETQLRLEPLTGYRVLTSGRNGEALTAAIHNKQNVLSITVFCMNVDFHRKWAVEGLGASGVKFTKVFEPTNKIRDAICKLAAEPPEEELAFIKAADVASRIADAQVIFMTSPLPTVSQSLSMRECAETLLRYRDRGVMAPYMFFWQSPKEVDRREVDQLSRILSLGRAVDQVGASDIMKLWAKEEVVNGDTRPGDNSFYRPLGRMLRQKINNIDGLKASKIAECLWLAMQTVQAPAAHGQGTSRSFRGKCYRGLALEPHLAQQFELNVGQCVFYRDFAAHSRRKDTAIGFSRKPGKASVLLEVDCTGLEGPAGFVDMRPYQVYNEAEVLAPLLTMFKIMSVQSKTEGVDFKVNLQVLFMPTDVDAAFIYCFS